MEIKTLVLPDGSQYSLDKQKLDRKDRVILMLYEALQTSTNQAVDAATNATQNNEVLQITPKQAQDLRPVIATLIHTRWARGVEQMLKTKCKPEQKPYIYGEAQTVGNVRTGAVIIPREYLNELTCEIGRNFDRLNEFQKQKNLYEADRIIDAVNKTLQA